MALAELGQRIKEFIDGGKEISASREEFDVDYTPGIPRQVTTTLLSTKEDSYIPNIKVTIEQRGKRYFAYFHGKVQVQSSLNGETIAVEGKLSGQRNSGIHIWWGGKYQEETAQIWIDDDSSKVHLESVDPQGANVIFRKKVGFDIPPKTNLNLARSRFSLPPPIIELVELSKDGKRQVLESNEKEVASEWEKAERVVTEALNKDWYNRALGSRMRI